MVRWESSAAKSLITSASPAPCRTLPVGSIARQFFRVVAIAASLHSFLSETVASEVTILVDGPSDRSGRAGRGLLRGPRGPDRQPLPALHPAPGRGTRIPAPAHVPGDAPRRRGAADPRR